MDLHKNSFSVHWRVLGQGLLEVGHQGQVGQVDAVGERQLGAGGLEQGQLERNNIW